MYSSGIIIWIAAILLDWFLLKLRSISITCISANCCLSWEGNHKPRCETLSELISLSSKPLPLPLSNQVWRDHVTRWSRDSCGSASLRNQSNLWNLKSTLINAIFYAFVINLEPPSTQYVLNGVLPSNVSKIFDLVNLDCNSYFKSHICIINAKAVQQVGRLSHLFTHCSNTIPLFVWNSNHRYLIDKLENVQRQFTKRVATLSHLWHWWHHDVTTLSHLTYHERPSVLKLEPLELRRQRFNLI